MSKTGRNDPCPCGSGKKYKKCCLAKEDEATRERMEARDREREDRKPTRGPEADLGDDADLFWEEMQDRIDELEDWAVRDLMDEIEDGFPGLDREVFERLARRLDIPSAAALLQSVVGNPDGDGADVTPRQNAVCALLWSRLLPDQPPAEIIFRELMDGDIALDNHDRADAWRHWRHAWPALKCRLPAVPTSLHAAVERFEATLDPADWVDRFLSFAQANRTCRPDVPNSEMAQLVDDLRCTFAESGPDFSERLGILHAELLLWAGDVAGSDAAFQALVDQGFPAGRVKTHWADAHCQVCPDCTGGVRDLDKAERLYREGFGPGPSDCAALEARLRSIKRLRIREGTPSQRYLEDEDLRQLVECGNTVPEDLWRRILERGREVTPLLNELMFDTARLMWDGREDGPHPSWGYAPCHAAFIAAEIGEPSSVEPLLMAADGDTDNDWLSAGMCRFPACFPPECSDVFLSFVLHGLSGWPHRASCADGVVWSAGLHPELRPKVASALAEAIGSGGYDRSDMVTWLVQAGMRTDDPGLREACRAAFERGVVDARAIGSFKSLEEEGADWYLPRGPDHLTAERYFRELGERPSEDDFGFPPMPPADPPSRPGPSKPSRGKHKHRKRGGNRRKNKRR